MDKIQNRPESELPWEYIPTWQDYMEGPDQWHNRDYKYVIHACNAYPKLIELVHNYMGELRLEWSQDSVENNEAMALLKELGEL